ncbi:MAG: CoA-binding protein [Firmicutes bacterium]|nr:CoA-binding protein [Bacillota bacterium]
MSAVEAMLAEKIWAVVGVSANRQKFGYKVYKKLQAAGYTVFAINPTLLELEGDMVYPTLQALPENPGVVNCVVPPQVTLDIIAQCAKLGIGFVWMQPGAHSAEAIALATKHNIQAECACVLVELDAR